NAWLAVQAAAQFSGDLPRAADRVHRHAVRGLDRPKTGGPGRTRNCDPRVWEPLLYSAELRGPTGSINWASRARNRHVADGCSPTRPAQSFRAFVATERYAFP